MTGDGSYKERMKKFEAILDEYQKQNGLSHILYNSEIEGVLSLTREELSNLTAEQCGESQFLLAQYSAYLQKNYNRHNAKLKWAERELSNLVAKECHNYGDDNFMNNAKFQLILGKVIYGNEAAKVLNQIVNHASACVNELNDMSTKISFISKALGDLQQSKRKYGYG